MLLQSNLFLSEKAPSGFRIPYVVFLVHRADTKPHSEPALSFEVESDSELTLWM